ncbi:cytochrome-c peroxidase [Nitrococcus mobilis]|uniref:Cytochrome c peroxidase n=1 Tax=Nitrococcus mobilis Nb-231 TaxID=314278 RepID=A4BSR1_9GAMM|nr:cytochrome c peroxidase [Nitrococcus mobilis]EAR21331.1 cytochrome c peroxidase [Nitrococcus mobilis Nb-231]
MKMSWILLATVALSTTGALAADAASLRNQAKAVFDTLPETMPGAEQDTPALIALGKRLYFDKQLSINGSQSCNTCHRLDNGLGGADIRPTPTSLGAHGEPGTRNTPTVLNAGFQIAQFWDGRAPTLEAQAKGPILNPVEMAMPDESTVIERITGNAGYVAAFSQAFPNTANSVTYDNVAKAIAAFERTLITHDRFDDFLNGDDRALTEQERKGLKTFMATGCTACHKGPLLGGMGYRKMGVAHPYSNEADLGRYDVTGKESDKYLFKVPMLRNVAITAPYFHDGAVSSLTEAVRQMAWLQLGLELPDRKVADITAFLGALTDKNRTSQPGKQ